MRQPWRWRYREIFDAEYSESEPDRGLSRCTFVLTLGDLDRNRVRLALGCPSLGRVLRYLYQAGQKRFPGMPAYLKTLAADNGVEKVP
jgi:hypothetical protein